MPKRIGLAAVAAGLLLLATIWVTVGWPRGGASAQEPPEGAWQTMHQACAEDYGTMLQAMQGVLDEDTYQAMLGHMNQMHPNGQDMHGDHQGMMGAGHMGGSMGQDDSTN